jgi:hypothetical protein
VDDELRGQAELRRNDRLASLNRREFIAGGLKLCRSRRFEESSAHAAAHCKGGVCGVYDSVNALIRDVVADY